MPWLVYRNLLTHPSRLIIMASIWCPSTYKLPPFTSQRMKHLFFCLFVCFNVADHVRILTVILHCVSFVFIEGMARARQKRHSFSERSSCTNSHKARLEYCMDIHASIYIYSCNWHGIFYTISCSSDYGNGHRCDYSGPVTRAYCCYYDC